MSGREETAGITQEQTPHRVSNRFGSAHANLTGNIRKRAQVIVDNHLAVRANIMPCVSAFWP